MTWPTLDPGSLRHPIKIWQMSSLGGDVSGTTVDPFLVTAAPPAAPTMASIEPVRGTDVIRGGQTTTTLYLTIKMWFQPGITPDMQVETESGSRFLIQSIENLLEMNLVLVLNCEGLGANQ